MHDIAFVDLKTEDVFMFLNRIKSEIVTSYHGPIQISKDRFTAKEKPKLHKD